MAAVKHGKLYATFRTLDNIPSGSNVSYGGKSSLSNVVDPRWNRRMNQIGTGSAAILIQDDWYELAAEGRICTVYQEVSPTLDDRIVTQFVVQEMAVVPRGNKEYIELSGSGPEWRLTRAKNWRPIGQETQIATELKTAVLEPWTIALAVGAPHGNESATLTTVADIQDGDEIRIRMGTANDGDWHIAFITGVGGVLGTNRVTYTPRIPYDAAAGNDVEIRKANLEVDSAVDMGIGQLIEIDLDDATVATARIVEVDDQLGLIVISTGLTDSAAIDNDVVAYDYSQLATDDVTQIVQSAPDWSVGFLAGNGSLSGSAFVPKGESVYDLLAKVADRTGEIFRYEPFPASGLPRFYIAWRHTPDSSGVTLVGYNSSTADHALRVSREDDTEYGIMYSLRSRREKLLITRVYAQSGDQRISLANCSTFALSYATSEGCEIVLSDDDYQPDYVQSTIDAADGVWEEVITYGDVSLSEAATLDEVQSASDNLLYEAVATIKQARARQFYEVECHTHWPIHPGQTIRIENRHAFRKPSINSSTDWIVIEATEYVKDGRSRSRLLVSNVTGTRPNHANSFARGVSSQTQSLKRVGGSASGDLYVYGSTGGGSGTIDDSAYLRVDGTHTLIGDMAVAAGKKIDGVDLSDHAANPAAHHSAVTLLNDGLLLSGQAAGLRLRPSSGMSIEAAAGLGMILQSESGLNLTASGLAVSTDFAGAGLYFTAGRVLNVNVGGSSGLQIVADALRLGTPLSVSVSSLNGLSASSHSHAVLAYSTAVDENSKLLKSGDGGELAVARLGVGVASTSSAALIAQAKSLSQHTLLIRQLVNQSGDMWRVENPVGGELIVLRGDGSLESGNPRFVSGQTGWQLRHDGYLEANTIVARGEFHTAFFSAHEMAVTGGTQFIMPGCTVGAPYGATDNRLPATIDSTFTLVLNADSATGLPRVAANDVLRIKTMGEVASGGSLDLYDVYVVVNSITYNDDRDMAAGNYGTYDITCKWRSGGEALWIVPTGAAVVVWTQESYPAGSYRGGIKLTSDEDASPFIDIFTIAADRVGSWPGSGTNRTPPAVTPRVRLGNLDGVLGNVETWGLAFGEDLSSSDPDYAYGILSSERNEFNNLNFIFREGGQTKLEITASQGVRVRADPTDQYVRGLQFYDYSNGRLVGLARVEKLYADGSPYRYQGWWTTDARGSSLPASNYIEAFSGTNQLATIYAAARADSGNVTAALRLYASEVTPRAWGSLDVDDFTVEGELTVGEALTAEKYLVIGSIASLPGSPDGRIFAQNGAHLRGLVLGDFDGPAYPQDGAINLVARTVTPYAYASTPVLYAYSSGGTLSVKILFPNGITRTIATD